MREGISIISVPCELKGLPYCLSPLASLSILATLNLSLLVRIIRVRNGCAQQGQARQRKRQTGNTHPERMTAPEVTLPEREEGDPERDQPAI